VWPAVCKVIGEPDWIETRPTHAAGAAAALKPIFARIEQWTMTKDKFEAMEILNQYDIPCGPILSMKEIAEEPALRATARWSRSTIRHAQVPDVATRSR